MATIVFAGNEKHKETVEKFNSDQAVTCGNSRNATVVIDKASGYFVSGQFITNGNRFYNVDICK